MLDLLGFHSDNFISNVNENLENSFRFQINKNVGYTFTVFRNQYTIQDLEKRFRECFKNFIDSMSVEETRKYNVNDFKISVNSNFKCVIKSPLNFIVNKKFGLHIRKAS